MNHPCFIYDTCRDDQTTVTASSSAAGYDPADILTMNEAVGWRPAYASSVWQAGGITNVPGAIEKTDSIDNAVVVWGNWAILINRLGKAYRLDMTNPTGAWDDAGITDPPGGSLYYTQAVVHGNYLYIALSATPFAPTYRLNLTNMTGAWDDAGVSQMPAGGSWELAADATYLYARHIIGNVYRLNVSTNPAGSWEQMSTLNYGESMLGKLAVIDGYLYHFTGTSLGVTATQSYSAKRLNLSTPLGAWENCDLISPGETQDMGIAVSANRAYAVGGTRIGAGGVIGYVGTTFVFSARNTVWFAGGYPQLPVALANPLAFVHGTKLYVLGGRTSPNSFSWAGYSLDLSGEYATIDYGQNREFDSVAVQARGMSDGVVEFWGSTDNFSSSNVFLGAAGGGGETGYIRPGDSMIYRYLRVRCFGYDSDFLLRNVSAGLCPLLPYMADGSLLDGLQCEGKQLITQEKLHLGTARTATLHLLSPDWGQLLDEEKEAFDKWARACVATLSPCYFVPDTDTGTVHFCWTDPKYKYDPTMKKGLWELGKISLTARG